MAATNSEDGKIFYTIGEISNELGENTSLVRFWSEKFSSIIKPQKNKKGNRLFSKDDFENFKLIHFLVREKGLTLDGAKKRIIENRNADNKNMEAIHVLQNIREMLLEVKNAM